MKEHRLYLHMSEPVRFLGLTTGELFLGLGGFLGMMFNSGNLGLGAVFLGGGWGGVFVLRQFKKHKVGVNLRSFLTWYGIVPAPSIHWPSFEKKRWR